MPAVIANPVLGTLTTAETDLTTGPASSAEEWLVDIRVTNKTSTAVDVDIAVSDAAGTNKAYEVYSYTIAGKDSKDISLRLGIPTGFKIRGRASANSTADYRLSIRKHLTTL